MAQSEADREFLKGLYRALSDKPLEPGDPYYVPIFQELELDDPVQQISTEIEFQDSESISLFSGFRGSGKTTELKRLKQELEARGSFVLYADALEYVNAAEPIAITDLLMVLAGAFSDALKERLGADLANESYWDRFLSFLNGEVLVDGLTLKAEGKTPETSALGGLKVGAEIKFGLRSATNFRRELHKALQNKLKELKDNADRFFEDGVKLIRARMGNDTKIVFIFDQLEQLRGTLQTEYDVIRSVQRIFATDYDLLRIPYVHMVYTVPPWLKLVLPGTKMTLLSTIHLWNDDKDRSRCEPAWGVFRSLVHRRLSLQGSLRLFGDQQAQQDRIDEMIAVCGGHFRDLLRLLRDTIVKATALSSLPIPAATVTKAIDSARREFLPIAEDDAIWLMKIAERRETALVNTEAETVNRLTRFFDNHFVLYFVNGREWYDIHPLIRDEAAKIKSASLAALASPPAP
jgi:hypothetical protein